MLFQSSNDTHHTSFQPNFPPSNDEGEQKVTMLNLFQSFEEEFQNRLYEIENEPKPSDTNQMIKNCHPSKHSSSASAPLIEDDSFNLHKELINDAETQSYFSVDRLQNSFLANSNNTNLRPTNNNLHHISKSAKHLSDDETFIHKETDMSDLVGTPISNINNNNTNSFSGISKMTSIQNEDSQSNPSFLDYTIDNEQFANDSKIGKFNYNQEHSLYDKKTNSIPVADNESDSNAESYEEDNEIPLGMAFGSKASTNLFLLSQSESKIDAEVNSTNHKNTRLSLTESRQHGKNNSGEFVGKKPSLMTVIEDEDDVTGEMEEVFEYEEEYEEEAENGNNIDEIISDTKPQNVFNNDTNIRSTTNNLNIHFPQPSGTMHNLYAGMPNQVSFPNNSHGISLNNFVKSYGGLNSKIINLNPPDDDDEYDYDSDNEVGPISLAEASEINRTSHQSGLSGSRTIEDLIREQKKAAIAASSSAIIALAATASSREYTDDDNSNNNKRLIKRRSNISLSELVPTRERTCFTVEDMMRLQNIHFQGNKEKCMTSNSGDKITKPQKPRYSGEEMMRDQKNFVKSKLIEKNDSESQDKEGKVSPPLGSAIATREIKLDDTHIHYDKQNSTELESSKLIEELNEEEIFEINSHKADEENFPKNDEALFSNTAKALTDVKEMVNINIFKECPKGGMMKILVLIVIIISLVILYNYNQKVLM